MTKVIIIPPAGIKFHGNPCNSDQNISLKTTYFSLMVVIQEKSVTKLLGFITKVNMFHSSVYNTIVAVSNHPTPKS